MTRNKPFRIAYKVFFALLSFSAIVTEIAVLVERATFNPANFFSYFTIETNSLVVVTLLLSAYMLAIGKESKLDMLRAATTVYILVVGIGFSLLLSGDAAPTVVPWDNTVLHYLIPIAVLIDFLIDPPKRALSFKKFLPWLLFPLGYAAYSLVRGTLTGWYPYPFLNPTIKGYGSVALIVAELLVLGLALAWCVTKYTALRKRLKTGR